jgi:hypothetical protein
VGLASAGWSLYDPDPSCQRARFPTDSHIRRPLVHLPHKSKPAWAAVETFVVCLFACLRIACCLLRAALSVSDPSVATHTVRVLAGGTARVLGERKRCVPWAARAGLARYLRCRATAPASA